MKVLQSNKTRAFAKKSKLTLKIVLENLHRDLSQFGLSPTDWQLQPTHENNFLIKNRNEANFTFIGRADTNALRWDYITLKNI